MKSICLYFQIHQPIGLRSYRFFDIGNSDYYYDDHANETLIKRLAGNCYLPANNLLLELIRKYEGKFRVSFSISGAALDQFSLYTPQVIDSFRELAQTGCVEFLAETYAHSLAAIKDEAEFKSQVEAHADQVERLLGQRPRVFRNSGLIYSDQIGAMVAELGFDGMLAEDAAFMLKGKSQGHVYQNAIDPRLKVLVRNSSLSEDIAHRYSNKSWKEWPLTATKYTSWLNNGDHDDKIINLFMDYENLGEHQRSETGIFDFFKSFPETVLHKSQFKFMTPSEAIASMLPVEALDAPHPSSWVDHERDLSAWLGNEIQNEAFNKLYELSDKVRDCNDQALLKDWHCLQSSDHFQYMCTKTISDSSLRGLPSPYDSPYDAFINYMNVLNDFSIRLDLWEMEQRKALLVWKKRERTYELS